jgi:hypothetical protein
MDKPEFGLDSSDALLSYRSIGLALDNFDTEKIIRITLEAFVTVGGNFVLPVSLGHRCADIVGVEASVGGDVVEANDTTIFDVGRTNVVPSFRAGEVWASVVIWHDWQSLVLQDPDVVLVLVGIEGNLLLLATSRVHVAVRVEVSTLSIPVAQRDTASISDVSGNSLHALGVQCRLELGRHEAIAFTRVDQADEVDSEHGHVKRNRDDDETKHASEEVLEP